MRIRTGVTERWPHRRRWTSRRFLDGGAYGSYGVASTYYTGALQTVTYDDSALSLPWLAACSRTSRRAVPSADTARHSRASARKCSSTRSPRSWSSTRPTCAGDIAPARQLLTANWLRIGSMGLAECIDAVVEASGLDARNSASFRSGEASALACSIYLSGAGLPIYWNAAAALGRAAASSTARGGVTAFCGSDRHRPGLATTCSRRAWPRCWGSSRWTSASSPATPTSRPSISGSYSSRVTLMMGNAAIQAAERARDAVAAPGAREARRAQGADRLRGTTRVRRRGSRERRLVRRGGPHRRERESATIGTRRLVHAAANRPAATRAAAWGRRRRTRTRAPSSRWRSIPRPASCACRGCGSRTTSAARSIRRWRMVRWKARCTWDSARALMEEMTYRERRAGNRGAPSSEHARVQESHDVRDVRCAHRR